MPTPGGKPKKGDRIRYVGEGGPIDCEVVERRGNDALYSVVLRRVDGEPFADPAWPYVKKELHLTEADYWLFQSGRWEVPWKK